MNILAKYTIVALLASVPILLAISRRYGTIILTAKQVAFTAATSAILLMGLADFFSGHHKTLFSLSLRGWIIPLLCWVYIYFLSLWIYKQLYQK